MRRSSCDSPRQGRLPATGAGHAWSCATARSSEAEPAAHPRGATSGPAPRQRTEWRPRTSARLCVCSDGVCDDIGSGQRCRSHGARHPRCRTRPEDEALEQRVAREPVGAVDAVHATSRRKEPGQRCPAVQVCVHAAHHVVGRRTDRDGVACRSQAGLCARLGDRREALLHEHRIEMGQRQVDGRSGALGLMDDSARDEIPRCQVARRLISLDERLAALLMSRAPSPRKAL